ncbi:unnamed protein product [Lactuca virosa]|uniref:Uncharacterized protein n=1 Tax=Lactuca virosa TaxID=75947 RepID=A0AAU9N4P1_9ASTR|nr:unnamed protein product [Lactuca virosa]
MVTTPSSTLTLVLYSRPNRSKRSITITILITYITIVGAHFRDDVVCSPLKRFHIQPPDFQISYIWV